MSITIYLLKQLDYFTKPELLSEYTFLKYIFIFILQFKSGLIVLDIFILIITQKIFVLFKIRKMIPLSINYCFFSEILINLSFKSPISLTSDKTVVKKFCYHNTKLKTCFIE